MVALLALAVQFASNFGHFHREWVGQPEAAQTEVTDHADHDHDHDHQNGQPHRCPICIAASFAQSFTPALPPALPELIAYTTAAPAPVNDAPASLRIRRPFQSRAPPLA